MLRYKGFDWAGLACRRARHTAAGSDQQRRGGLCAGAAPGRGLETAPRQVRHGHVISGWAEATTISMPGPVTCSPLTVIDPALPPDELVCSLTLRAMPPGNEMARFGFETAIGWPAATRPTISKLPVDEAVEPLQEALEFDLTTSAATSPPNRFRFAIDDCD